MTIASRKKRSKTKRVLGTACVAAPTLLGFPSITDANVLQSEIVNADFEEPDLVGFGQYATSAPGWELFSGAVQTESVFPFDNGVGAMNNGFTAKIRQETGHVMSLGEVFALKADVFTRSDATEVSLELFAVLPGGVLADYNGDGVADAGDYVVWRKNDGSDNALPNDNGLGVPIGPAHYDLWRANFGNMTASGGGFAATPFATAILDNSDDHADDMWTREFPFGGTAGPAEAGLTLGIQFRNSSGAGQDNNGGQVLIDNVMVAPTGLASAAVPEPGTFSLVCGGLISISSGLLRLVRRGASRLVSRNKINSCW